MIMGFGHDAIEHDEGMAHLMQVNLVSKQKEYQGHVRSKVGAMSNMPHGGQVVVDAETYRDLMQHQSELQHMVEAHPDYDALASHIGRWA